MPPPCQPQPPPWPQPPCHPPPHPPPCPPPCCATAGSGAAVPRAATKDAAVKVRLNILVAPDQILLCGALLKRGERAAGGCDDRQHPGLGRALREHVIDRVIDQRLQPARAVSVLYRRRRRSSSSQRDWIWGWPTHMQLPYVRR